MELLKLLADGQFHSGVDLAQQLQVSRTTISKRVAAWQAQGLDIDTVTGKGYRLQTPIDWLNQQTIYQYIPQHIQHLMTDFSILSLVSSTNDVVAQQLQQKAQSGVVCLAEMQSLGRGRRGKTWLSPPAGTFYGSVGWVFNEGFQVLEGLSLAIGVAVANALTHCGAQDLQLKWPNDIVWQGKKLGGVLIEMSAEVGGACHVVVGAGVNLALPQGIKHQIEQDVADFREICPHSNRQQVTAMLISHIVQVLSSYAVNGFKAYRQKWQSYDALLGLPVKVLGLAQTIEGIAAGIDEQGAFLIQTSSGLQAISGGEVSVRKI
jgi:BirA family biotin operon repressor/biotin-[acetyl-CoA-carboxylase] ligase